MTPPHDDDIISCYRFNDVIITHIKTCGDILLTFCVENINTDRQENIKYILGFLAGSMRIPFLYYQI